MSTEISLTLLSLSAAKENLPIYSSMLHKGLPDPLSMKREQPWPSFHFPWAFISPPPSKTLRLYIGGGTGIGQSHVLRAIEALVDNSAPTDFAP